MTHNRQVTAIGGKTIMIPCSAIGLPKPRISWILPNFSTLHRCSIFVFVQYSLVEYIFVPVDRVWSMFEWM